MDNSQLATEIKYYQLYIGKAIAQIYINEKICDFHDNDIKHFDCYASSFGQISSALLLSQRIIFCNIFIQDKESKNIHKLLNRLISNKIANDTETDLQIKEIANNLKKSIDKQSTNISKLKDYRDNAMAHFNTQFFNDEWRKTFPVQNACKFMDIADLAIEVFEGLSQITILLNDQPLDKGIMEPFDIKYAIFKLSK